jgi:cephalosporin-C deacetylase-like acetyl esterase
VTPLLLLLAFFQPPEDIRAKMLDLIGGLPTERTALNARITGAFDRPGYRVEKVIFDSLPGFHVTADLYIPTEGQGPFPAILGVAGHSDNGKASATYQHAWISFARRGYVVLAYDPPGQGERIEYFDPDLGRSRLSPGVPEHISAGLQCLLTGKPIARYFIWDGIRAFDYLTTRSEVDPTRIAVAGNSGGGTQAAYLAVFEPRLAAVVSSCYITRWKELLEGPGPQDAEQIFPRFLSSNLDFIDFIRAFAPKPFLVTSAVRDFFPIAGARATAEAAPNASFFEYDDTHGWSQPRREAAYSFLDKHLKNSNADAHEAPLTTEPESALWATPTGHLANSIGTESVFTLNRAIAREMYPRRRALSLKDPAEFRALIARRLGLGALTPTSYPARQGKPAILAANLPEADLADLRQAGFIVRVVDLPKFGPGRSSYSGAYQAAAREWLYNRTLLGWRVAEMLSAFRQLAADPQVDPSQIAIWGRGNSGVTALLAAALEPQAAKVMAEDTVTSFYAITQSLIHENTAEIIVPGVLEDFDLPDLVNLIAPRPLWLADPRTATGARSLAPEYNRNWVHLHERPEGWPATKAFFVFLTAPTFPAKPGA